MRCPAIPKASDVGDTYPWLAASEDLAARGYVEQEFTLSGAADAYDATGRLLASDVPYTTRVIVRRPAHPLAFNGVVLTKWQNVTAGYDLDALWSPDLIMRGGYAWVGVSALQSASNSSAAGARPATTPSTSPAAEGSSLPTSSPTTSSPRPPRRSVRVRRSAG
nr:alpha/beta hydrolase domain-containing protein [Herbidospora cretacea]